MVIALRTLVPLAACLLVAVPAVGQAAAADPQPPEESLGDLLTDDEDGRFDVSELVFSPSRVRFLPIPILITEPAVGYGFGLAPVWFHQRPDRSSGQLVPPSVSVGAGFLTSDGSWGGGGGHFHSWRDDTWRFLGFGGRASLELESAGISPQLDVGRSLEYLIDGTFLLLEGSTRVSPRTRLGLRYVYAETEVDFGGEDVPPDLAGSGRSAASGCSSASIPATT